MSGNKYKRTHEKIFELTLPIRIFEWKKSRCQLVISNENLINFLNNGAAEFMRDFNFAIEDVKSVKVIGDTKKIKFDHFMHEEYGPMYREIFSSVNSETPLLVVLEQW